MVFHIDPATTRGQLQLSSGALADADREELETELTNRYQALTRGQKEKSIKVRFGQFRVRVEDGSEHRLPKLILDEMTSSGMAQARAPANAEEQGWVNRFFAELDGTAADCPAQVPDAAERAGLEFAVNELRARTLAQAEPRLSARMLAVLLLAGYCSAAQRYLRLHDAARSALYVLAARGLDRILLALASDAKLWQADKAGDSSEQAPAAKRPSTLSRLLAWCLGWAGPKSGHENADKGS
jgi:hypothetical protein